VWIGGGGQRWWHFFLLLNCFAVCTNRKSFRMTCGMICGLYKPQNNRTFRLFCGLYKPQETRNFECLAVCVICNCENCKFICMLHFRIMARTKGGSSQPEGQERPIASVRRGDRRDGARPAVVHNVPPYDDAVGFPRGPSDPSALVSYVDHVAYRLWAGEVKYLKSFVLFCWFKFNLVHSNYEYELYCFMVLYRNGEN